MYRPVKRDDTRQSSSEYPWMSASSQHFHPSMRKVPDSFAPPAFNGTNMDADAWLAHFQRYAEYRQLADRDITQIFPLFLKDSAIDWYDTLSTDLKSDLESLLGNFTSCFGKTELDYAFADETVFTRVQRPNEKARDYISQMHRHRKGEVRSSSNFVLTRRTTDSRLVRVQFADVLRRDRATRTRCVPSADDQGDVQCLDPTGRYFVAHMMSRCDKSRRVTSDRQYCISLRPPSSFYDIRTVLFACFTFDSY